MARGPVASGWPSVHNWLCQIQIHTHCLSVPIPISARCAASPAIQPLESILSAQSNRVTKNANPGSSRNGPKPKPGNPRLPKNLRGGKRHAPSASYRSMSVKSSATAVTHLRDSLRSHIELERVGASRNPWFIVQHRNLATIPLRQVVADDRAPASRTRHPRAVYRVS